MSVEFDRERFSECANWLVNRVDGKRRRDVDTSDLELLQRSTVSDTPSAFAIACQVGGCSVMWAMDKNSDGTYGRAMQVGLSACPSE